MWLAVLPMKPDLGARAANWRFVHEANVPPVFATTSALESAEGLPCGQTDYLSPFQRLGLAAPEPSLRSLHKV